MNLSKKEMLSLFPSVFPHLEQDKNVAILVDIPRSSTEDNSSWATRREIAIQWKTILFNVKEKLGIQKVDLIAYPNIKSNNADLPNKLYICKENIPSFSDNAFFDDEIIIERMFQSYQIFLVLSEYSATAPMKIAAKKYFFRAATMAGFSDSMLPALRIDYNVLSKRLKIIKKKLDSAKKANVKFIVGDNEYKMQFDLKNTHAHVSSGIFPEKGMVGNLPSGETYIVPNEDVNSETEGVLPVQFEKEIVLYQIKNNKVQNVLTKGAYSQKESEHLQKEPAYGNIAELGFGILSDFGIEPIGEVLLDEKLGFHIAFGRSDHFGGRVGVSQFSCANAVVHIDYVYISNMQPLIKVAEINLEYANHSEVIMKNGNYLLWERT